MSGILNVVFALNDPNGANVEFTTSKGNKAKLSFNDETPLAKVNRLVGSEYCDLIGPIIDAAVEGNTGYSQPTLFDENTDDNDGAKLRCNAGNPYHCAYATKTSLKTDEPEADEFEGNYTVDEFRELLDERRNAATLVNGIPATDPHYSYFNTFRDAAAVKPKLRVSFVYVDRVGMKTSPVLTLIDDEVPGDENGFYVRNVDDEFRRYNFDGIKSAKVKVEEI